MITVISLATCVMILLTEVQMHELTEIVIQKIMAEWEAVAFCMRYEPNDVEGFRADSQDLKQCCKKLFLNWITTDHGPKPKTYQTLLNHFKKVKDLAAVLDTIKEELIQGRNKQFYAHFDTFTT